MNDSAKTGMYIGIGISAVIVLAVVGLAIYFLTAGTSIGEPTRATTAKGALDEIKLNLDMSPVFSMPSGGSGAQASYTEAVKLALEGTDPAQLIVMSKQVKEPEKHPKFKMVIEKIVAAADQVVDGELNFDSVSPMSPLTDFYFAEVLKTIGRVTNKAALSYRADAKNNPEARAKAEAHMRAAYIFGRRLWDNGSYVGYKSAGMAIIAETMQNLQRHYHKDFFNDPSKVDQLKAMYEDGLKPAWLNWQEKEKIFRTVKPVPGDLHNLIEKDKDRAWRLQGMQWMGMAKWTSADGNQRKAIEAYIASKTSDGDPLMAKMATVAKDFTRLDVNNIPNVTE